MTQAARQHCCDEMRSCLADPRLPISYLDFVREYILRRVTDSVVFHGIEFCPWCGIKLPSSRRDRWFDELDDLGLDDPFGDDRGKVPPQYWSDEWWRYGEK